MDLSNLPTSRTAAIQTTSLLYFTGEPCKHGHIAARRTVNSTCEECHKVTAANQYAKHKDNIRRARKEYYWANPELARQKSREWNADNKERVSAAAKDRYLKNKEFIKKRVREYQNRDVDAYRERRRKKYASLSDEQKQQLTADRRNRFILDPTLKERTYRRAQQYRTEHRDRVRALKISYYARRRMAPGIITDAGIALRHTQQQRRCYYCDKPYGAEFHIDHIMPLSRGGSNDLHNIAVTCPTCNLRKRSKLPWEFLFMVARERANENPP